jgi:uncharacterized protein YcaQ
MARAALRTRICNASMAAGDEMMFILSFIEVDERMMSARPRYLSLFSRLQRAPQLFMS